MKEFKLNNKSYQTPTCWEEVNLKTYIDLVKLEQNKSEYLITELYVLKIMELLCGSDGDELNDLTMEMVRELSEDLIFIHQEPTFPVLKVIKVGDVDYVFPQDLNKLTMGEYISMKTFQESVSDGNMFDAIPYFLAVVLRPGRLVMDEETKQERWTQDKFDANNIEYRRELFMNVPVCQLMGPINFFLSGNK